MSDDDIVKRLHSLSSRTAYEAADEIARLHAELEVERNKFRRAYVQLEASDKANRSLAAELAAERERAEDAEKACVCITDQLQRTSKQRDKLREALNMAVALLPEHRREYFDAVLEETK